MPATPIQGGGFQDCLGNPIANGRLIISLSQEALDTLSESILVCPLEEVSYPLDASGNIVTTDTPLVWANNNLTPTTTYYMARVYTAGGQLAWGPNAVYAIVSGGVVSISQWTPGNPA
jgi:hypothetical protein